MSTANSEATLLAWDGASDLTITGSFSITYSDSTATNWPLAVNPGAPITIAGGAQVITIDVGNSNDWYGLFNTTGASPELVTVTNLNIVFVSGVLNTNSSILLFKPSLFWSVLANTTNPAVTFSGCSINMTSASVASYVNLTDAGPQFGGFIGTLSNTKGSTSITLTNCLYTGPYYANGSPYIGGGNGNGGAPTISCTVTYTSCFCDIVNPANWGANACGSSTDTNGLTGGFFSNASRNHTVSMDQCGLVVSTLNGQTTVLNGFAGGVSLFSSLTNSYVYVADTTITTSQKIQFICMGNYSAYTISNCVFIQDPSILQASTAFYTIKQPLSQFNPKITAFECAFSSFTINTSTGTPSFSLITQGTGTTFTYTYTDSTNAVPFTTWDSTNIWDNIPNTISSTPPYLKAFRTSPWTSSAYDSITSIPALPSICILEGTRILTTDGYLPIENLTKDHILITRKGHTTRIVEILELDASDVRSVRIPKDAFGRDRPFEEVYISEFHAIYLDEQDTFLHIAHNNEKNFEIKKGKEWGKRRMYCIETEDYYKDILVAGGLGVEGYMALSKLQHGWECNVNESRVCNLIQTTF